MFLLSPGDSDESIFSYILNVNSYRYINLRLFPINLQNLKSWLVWVSTRNYLEQKIGLIW